MATEFWFGLEVEDGADVSAIAPEHELIPAEDMTESELSIVHKWIHVNR